MKKLIIFWICIFLIQPFAFSRNHFAAPNASGSGNSYDDPCEFLSALSRLSSGDTLFVLGGQYDYAEKISISASKSGTAANRTVIMAWPGEKPVFDFRNMVYGERGISIATGSQYFHLKGLTIRYAGKNGLINYGSYCLLENLDVYGCGDSGIQMKTGGANVIKNCDSHDNFDYQLGGLTAADYGGNADGFADKQHSGPANTYIGCRSWNNSDDGWDFFDRYTDTPTIMENCICYANGPAFYDMTDHPRYEQDKEWLDQFLTERQVTDDDGNQITLSLAHYVNLGNGNGFKLGGNRSTHNVELRRCLSVKNTVRGYDQNNNFGAMVIYNASAYDNGCDYGFGSRDGGSVTVKNSLSLSSRSANYFKCLSVVEQNNSWNTQGVSCTAADFASLDVELVLEERQADGSLPQNLFMQLVENSDLIDAGVNVGLPFSGAAPDLGCYESGDFTAFPCAINCISNNTLQSVLLGNAIQPVVFQWSGGAITAVADNLPQGLTASLDDENNTITISGVPTAVGSYEWSVTATGNDVPEATAFAAVYVKPISAKRVAYLTVPDSPADKLILDKLNANNEFFVSIHDAAMTNDFSDYDLVVLSPVPNSAAAGVLALETVEKPILLLKPFALKSSGWNWGNAINTADRAMTVTNPQHPLFQNLSLEQNTLECFSQVQTNAVTAVDSWQGNPSIIHLATPSSNSSADALVELTSNTNMNGTVLSHPLIMMGISEYSTAYLTNPALQVIENACCYLLGMDIPSYTALPQPEQDQWQIRTMPGMIEVQGENDVQALLLYSITGQTIAETRGAQLHLPSMTPGAYLLEIRSDNGISTISKLLLQ